MQLVFDEAGVCLRHRRVAGLGMEVAVCVHVRGQCPVSLPLGPRVGARQHCMQRVRIGGQSPECARQNNRPSYGTQHDRD